MRKELVIALIAILVIAGASIILLQQKPAPPTTTPSAPATPVSPSPTTTTPAPTTTTLETTTPAPTTTTPTTTTPASTVTAAPVKYPEPIPGNPCTKCHSGPLAPPGEIHVVHWKPNADCRGCHPNYHKERVPNVTSQNCFNCHFTTKGPVHWPPEMDPFHVEHYEHQKIACTKCHSLESTYVNATKCFWPGCHANVKDWVLEEDQMHVDHVEKKHVACEACHFPDLVPACTKCHKIGAPKENYSFPYSIPLSDQFHVIPGKEEYHARAINCTECHTSEKFMPDQYTCLMCHFTDKGKYRYPPKYDTFHIVHYEIKHIDCRKCHLTTWIYPNTTTCLKCHIGAKEEYIEYKGVKLVNLHYSHVFNATHYLTPRIGPKGIEELTGVNPYKVPLKPFDCLECHDVNGTMTTQAPFTDYGSLLKVKKDSNEVCFMCHNPHAEGVKDCIKCHYTWYAYAPPETAK